jgi:hypothetical protein
MHTRLFVITLVLGVGVGAATVAMFASPRHAEAQQPPATGQRSGLFTLQLRGAQQSLNDTVCSTLLEYDPPRAWQLLVIGARGKGQFTCELRSADRAFLVTLQRAIADAREVSVSCVNGTPSTRGGVSIDLDSPQGGSFVLGSSR